MASLIKNQIIKHLSAFARNLTPDQISVEVLRGKGELKNIELNEVVLTERLELPSWLRIVRATCNRVSVKVPWTKLKTSAVELSIDEIEVVLSLSAVPPTTVPKKTNAQSGKAYDFGERVIEGLSISVQTLSVHFTSDCFGGSIMFQRLSVASKSPQFKDQADLHLTRVHDKSINQLIFFKQVSWEMCKIEASALRGSDVAADADGARRNALNSPLRLIMHNGGKCKIAIKKNDLNCSVISARIEVHLDEILWVATLLQLRSAIDFYKHIQNLVKASEKDNSESFLIDLPQKQNANTNPTLSSVKPTATNPVSLAFQKYDIPRSSHHFRISKIDLCLFDDSNGNVLPADWDINNGAIQAVLHELRVDYYPSHAVFTNGAFADRSDWVKYNAFNSCRGLSERHLSNYYAKICENFEPGLSSRIQRVWPSLHSRNVVLRIEDIVVQCVSEQSTTKDSIQQLFAPSKLRRFADLPVVPTISFLHMEFASYYFLASDGYPLPPDTSHIVMGPLDLLADGRSVRWMVYVFENILNAFDESLDLPATANQPYFCAEFVEPTVIFNAPQLTDDSRLPTRFLLNFSSVSVCNFLLPASANTASPSQPLAVGDSLFSPFNALAQLTANCRAFAAGRQSVLSRYLDIGELMKRIDLFENAADYANSIDSVYRTIDDIRLYVNIPSLSFASDFGRNSFETPIVADSSLLVVVAPQKPIGTALVHLRSDVLVTVDHFQLVRLIQLQSQITDLVDQIDSDRRFFAGRNAAATMADKSADGDIPFAILCDLQDVDVSLVLPIVPLPSPYDLIWSPPSMTLENTSDSLATPPIGSEPRLNELKSQLSDRRSDLELNKNDDRSGWASTNPFLDDLDNVEASLVAVADVIAEQSQMAELSLKDFRSCASAASLNNFAVGRVPSSSTSHQQAALSARSASFAMAPPEPISELRPSSRQLLPPTGGLHRAEFSTGSLPGAEADRMSLFDDTASVSIADYQRLLIDDVDTMSMIGGFGGGAAGSADGPAEDAELAEEADAMDERDRWADVREKAMTRCVNVLNAKLAGVGVAVVIDNGGGGSAKSATTADGAHTNVFVVGDVSTVSVGERLGEVFGDLSKGNAQNATASRTRTTTMTKEPVDTPKEVHFQVRVNQRKETLIEVDVDGAGKSFKLSDDVVSQLAPFAENTELDEEPPNPPELRLNVSNLNVEIKNPKRKHPLRIRLGSAIAINDGPTFADVDFS